MKKLFSWVFLFFESIGKATLYVFESLADPGHTVRKWAILLPLLGVFFWTDGEWLSEQWVRSAQAFIPIETEATSDVVLVEPTYTNDLIISALDVRLESGSPLWLGPDTYNLVHFFEILKLSNWDTSMYREVTMMAFCESSLDPSKASPHSRHERKTHDVGLLGIWEKNNAHLDFRDMHDLLDPLRNLNAGHELYHKRGGWYPSWKSSKSCMEEGPQMDHKVGGDGWKWLDTILGWYFPETHTVYVASQ